MLAFGGKQVGGRGEFFVAVNQAVFFEIIYGCPLNSFGRAIQRM